MPATTTHETDKFDFGVVLWGFAAVLLITAPIWLGFVAYLIASLFGSPRAEIWGECTGWAALLAVPAVVLGKALNSSYVGAGNRPVVEDSQNRPASNEGRENRPTEHANWEDTQKDTLKTEVVEAWKTSVQVQQHFNQLELQIRNFAVSLVAAVMGGAAFVIKERYELLIGHAVVSAAIPILLAGVVGLLAFYFMDRFWYHNLLIGSVKHALKIEKRYNKGTPELELSTSIGRESPQNIWKFEIHSSEKIDLFYAAVLTLLIMLTGGMLFARHVASAGSSDTTAQPAAIPIQHSENQTNVYMCPSSPPTIKKKPVKQNTTACPTNP